MTLEEKLEKVEKTLSRDESVEAAYLFGSYAEGREHEESDIDIAVLIGENLDLNRIFDLEKQLSGDLGIEVDITVLNGKKPRFAYNVLRRGELIFSKDEEARAKFEYTVMKDYFDLKPFYDEYDRYVQERVTG